MRKPIFFRTVLAILLLVFLGLAVTQAREQKQLQLHHSIELKSKESQLIELDNKYEELLNSNSEDKDEQLKKIRELEAELEARKNTPSELQETASNALNSLTGTRTAYAQSSQINGCSELRQRLSKFGVRRAELDSAIKLAIRESGCSSGAINSSSGACGSFQSLPCGKWGSPGTDQYLRGAINYSKSRYGGFVGALNHSLANNWY